MSTYYTVSSLVGVSSPGSYSPDIYYMSGDGESIPKLQQMLHHRCMLFAHSYLLLASDLGRFVLNDAGTVFGLSACAGCGPRS